MTFSNADQATACHYFDRIIAPGIQQQICNDVGSIAVKKERCTTAVPKNMLFDAFQVIFYNLIVWMIQKARKFKGRKIAECSGHSMIGE